MRNDIDLWLSHDAFESLGRLGIGRGQNVVDFGCGPGYYAVPAAQLVAPTGKVVAVDKSRMALFRLRRLMRARHVTNLTLVAASGTTPLPIAEHEADVVFLFDVLHSFYFARQQMMLLLADLRRAMKPDGHLALYPSHTRYEELEPAISSAGFRLHRRLEATMLHAGALVSAQVMTLRLDDSPAIRSA